jgi:hypothetical protein
MKWQHDELGSVQCSNLLFLKNHETAWVLISISRVCSFTKHKTPAPKKTPYQIQRKQERKRMASLCEVSFATSQQTQILKFLAVTPSMPQPPISRERESSEEIQREKERLAKKSPNSCKSPPTVCHVCAT